MAHHDVAAVWNPALRSDDHERASESPIPSPIPSPVPTGPNVLEIDTAIEATTIPLDSPMETPHDVTIDSVFFADDDSPADWPEAAAPDTTDAHFAPTADQGWNHNEVLEASPSHDTQAIPEMADQGFPDVEEPQVAQEQGNDDQDILLDDTEDQITEAQPVHHQEEEETIPAENGDAQAFFADERSTTPRPSDRAGGNLADANGEIQSSHDIWGSPANEDTEQDEFFDQLKTQTKPIWMSPEPADSRFEEGIPLLGDMPDSPAKPAETQDSSIDNFFAGDDENVPFLDDTPESPAKPAEAQDSSIDNFFAGDEDEEDGFFKAVQDFAPQEVPEDHQLSLHITRKSTSQVMDSLGVSLDSPMSDADPAAQEFDSVLAAASSESNVKKVSSDEDLAARWQAELAEESADLAAPEDDLAARWQAELDDDDDDLLLEEEEEVGQESAKPQESGLPNVTAVAANAVPPSLGSPFGASQSFAQPKAPASAYTPHQPSTSDLLHGVPLPGAVPPANTAATADYFNRQPPPSAGANKAESFAERAKEGYRSPYDLPDDLARPRRPVVSHKPVIAQPGSMPPPPRSNSFPVPPPTSSTMPTPPMGTASASAVPAPKNFYEELPLPPPRAQSRPVSSGRYTPGPHAVPPVNTHAVPPVTAHAPPPPANQYASIPPAPQPAVDSYAQPQMQQPERLDPYASLAAPNIPSGPSIPSASTSRYSPKPPTLQAGTKPPASPRYSPAPPPAAAPAPPRNRYASQPSIPPIQGAALPFQPRTSSPLAYHEKVSYRPQESFEQQPSVQQTGPAVNRPAVAPEVAIDSGAANGDVMMYQETQPLASPPRNPYAPSDYVDEFSKRVAPIDSAPPAPAPPVDDSPFVPPRRSMTQSPGQQTLGPRLSVPSVDPLQRPASVHGSGSPTKAVNPYAPAPVSAHNRVASQSLDFIPPTDDQQFDPLERWKGAPIVQFGFGGSILSCFPKHIPRYSAGQPAPKIKSSPGEIKIHQVSDWIPTPETIARHPGPLKSKSKKKDLLAWLSSKIAALENEGIPASAQLHEDSHKRHDEKVLLWKIVRVLVEHDGVLEGSPDVVKSLRQIIFPHLQNSDSEQTYGSDFPSLSTQPMDAPSQPDAVNPQAVESIRNSLLVGEREKAVWSAVDNRLWGHAMTIASTMDKSVWKQVVQEFVRREVRSTSGNTESLAALYEIFAGNVEESIDELVPPSARAGLQMVSKVNGQGPSKNALDGLNSWRDTLGLVLSNRSAEDYQALLALGRLLSSYGRVEAAHICFIVSRAAVFGGVDDLQANVVLLGVDHQRSSPAALQDEDSILLTEAYEYATSVLSTSPKPTLPHLLAFKLVYAWSLADRGRKTEALQYCDAIAATLKATTKPSSFHHQHLYYGVDELSARLRQTASEGGSSWISKPSMEKVSGSMWAKFNSFVAGEDNEAASSGSAKAGDGDIGPFAKIAGTPSVSRSPSMSDIYAPYSAQPNYASGPSRYQPNNQYAPTSSPEQFRGRSSLDSQRSTSFGTGFGQRRGSQEPSTPVDNMYQGGMLYNSPPAVGFQSTPPQTSYVSLAPVKEDLAPQPHAEVSPAPVQESFGGGSPYQPHGYGSFGQPFSPASATGDFSDGAGYMPPVGGGGYEPPSGEGEEPVATMPEEPSEEKPVKKSFMDDDDDDDLAARAAAVQKAERARKDREADEAFRKAAEADAQRPGPAKKGWFGGWFGGPKKEGEMPATANKPIRAKLGEQSSFYYDTDLKKWVNKKDPNSATAARATPPPPRGSAPPSRTASGSSAAPPPPASASPMLSGPSSRPPSTTGVPPPPGSPGPSSLGLPPPPPSIQRSVSTGAAVPTPPSSLAAPPRPATSLSNASSIDDLLGAPQARKGPSAKPKKKGRYVDVMAK
ncbi:hypothetical protein BO70DRAFT_431701 [Aspergillus heteromorphus CBS 117.55]|uniref:Protein transport protein sec16 n=1 Tax=Aspergillus heteromorphus CBS 117.55 TaxID=1448321 RepID=A0A317VGN8_9EURO|nr:uncharacterized protein BO70DRAFT_431701 [Aspergillus heteromorphus CBS 117.55]PWY72321.1 hypothetical protein BO70DRAFT_431701 [Aspergillus heteromorphus CBS 117.55]